MIGKTGRRFHKWGVYERYKGAGGAYRGFPRLVSHHKTVEAAKRMWNIKSLTNSDYYIALAPNKV